MENLDLEMVQRLYSAMSIPYSEEIATEDYVSFTLSENVGRDGQNYYWYMDTQNCMAINKVTGELISESQIEEIF